jgi:hypothetical protein
MAIDTFEDSEIKQWARLTLPGIPAPPLGTFERRVREEGIDERLWLIQKLEREVAKEKFSLAPIRALPREALSLIFEHWMQTPLTIGEERTRFNFLQVCRLWKDVGLSNPNCWNRVAGEFGNRLTGRENGTAFLYSRLSMAAKYSKGVPLDFRVTFNYQGKYGPYMFWQLFDSIRKLVINSNFAFKVYEEHLAPIGFGLFAPMLLHLDPKSLATLTHLSFNDGIPWIEIDFTLHFEKFKALADFPAQIYSRSNVLLS